MNNSGRQITLNEKFYVEPEIVEEEETEEKIDVPPEARDLITQPLDRPLTDLYSECKRGILELRPYYQRYNVFDKKKKSRLIESALLNIPIPVIYLAEEEDFSSSVIDGQQRLQSFFDFFDNKYTLSGLNVLTELNNKKFREIEKKLQNKILNYSLRCILIKKESHPDLRFDIFERLNTGAVQLNDMELRNCIYFGNYNELLIKLTKNKDWGNATGFKYPHKRMLDREMILRFFALYDNFNTYSGKMKKFLNTYMEKNRTLNEEELKSKENLFKNSIRTVYTIFGNKSFKGFNLGTGQNPDGIWDTRLNKSIFDMVMLNIARYPSNQLIRNADLIRLSLVDLLIDENFFEEYIKAHTTDKIRLIGRVEKWENILFNAIGPPKTGSRSFPKTFRQLLFEREPTCQLCGNQILTLEDCHVDHIDPYSKGGETIPENAQLTHRYCNLNKGTNNPL